MSTSSSTMDLVFGHRISFRINELRQEMSEKRAIIDFSINRVQSMNLMEEKTMENLISIGKLMENIQEAIKTGEKLRIISKDKTYLYWAENNIPSEKLESMRMSDEVTLLIMKQTAKNVITRMKNLTN